MNYVLGIDGGGTKATAVVMDEQGGVCEWFSGEAVNVNSESRAAVEKRLSRISTQVQQRFPNDTCVAVCAGVAGYTNRLTAQIWNKAFGNLGPRFLLTGDHMAALEGSLNGGAGMIMIAGTGSICAGRGRNGMTARAGGYGHLLDDGGSGYAISIAILSAVVRAADGRAAPTLLTQSVYKALDVHDIEGLIGVVYDKAQTKRSIASLSPLLDDAVKAGDVSAQNIARRAGEDLFALADAVCRKVGLDKFPCAMTGGVLQHSISVREAFIKRMQEAYPRIQCIEPLRSAAEGAGLLALRIWFGRKDG